MSANAGSAKCRSTSPPLPASCTARTARSSGCWDGCSSGADAFFQIERLYRFNQKFNPRWEARYLMYEGALNLPRTALAALWIEGQLPRPRLRRGTSGIRSKRATPEARHREDGLIAGAFKQIARSTTPSRSRPSSRGDGRSKLSSCRAWGRSAVLVRRARVGCGTLGRCTLRTSRMGSGSGVPLR